MKRVRVLAILLFALGIALPVVSMVPTPSRMECPKGFCSSNDDCPDGTECDVNPPVTTCGHCVF